MNGIISNEVIIIEQALEIASELKNQFDIAETLDVPKVTTPVSKRFGIVDMWDIRRRQSRKRNIY